MTFFRTLISIFVALSTAFAFADDWISAFPETDATQDAKNQRLSLNGEWAFFWEEWVPAEQIKDKAASFQRVAIPNYLATLIPPAPGEDFTHGISTYAKRIKNLNAVFTRPAIRMRDLTEAWRAYWITADGDVTYLGQSGVLSTDGSDTIVRDRTYILDLPRDTPDGLLLVHVSSHHYSRSGLYGELIVEEQPKALRAIMIDLFSRALLFGIGIYVIAQNSMFFIQRPKEVGLMLLAIVSFVGFARSSVASGYITHLLPWDSLKFILVKFEYILVIWPGVAALHYVSHLFPYKHSINVLKLNYAILFAFVGLTVFWPVSYVSLYLTYYQLALLFSILCTLFVISRGIYLNMPDSRHFLTSIVPLILATMNDVYAARTPGYHLYLAEYALFIFLFLQTQIQATRFIMALDTAEHLTDNLQAEVDLKTKELSKRNAMLEEKADHLESQHQQIKFLSETDHLTGLYNRQTLESYSEILFKLSETYDQPMSLIMMDLDHFKQINDRFGHLVGDECLVFTASYLRGFTFRKRDIIARYGGEELTLILNDTTLEAAKALMQRICDGLSEYPVQGEHPDIHLTASFGIAERISSGAKSFHDLIDFADRAMYRAKDNGRNRVELYEPETEVEL